MCQYWHGGKMAYTYTHNGITYYVAGGTTWQVTSTGLVRVRELSRPWWTRLWGWLRGLR